MTERTVTGVMTLKDCVFMFATRDELAVEYARLLREREPGWVGWPVLNSAILDRWSESGLRYVKREAWKLNAR